ncbi:hypothetical protein L7F22_064200 [Adiantum nelumboides]|nr:hypothetical protein [Adiantum nelumboides]
MVAYLEDDPLDIVRKVKAANMRAAVAINRARPTSEISNELGESVDMILVMTVWPGYGGQIFMKECMPKVAELRARFPNLDIEVDGGVGPKTIDRCADAGANVLVAGTAIFAAEDPKEVISFLRQRCEEAQERIKAEREQILFDPSSAVDDEEGEDLAEKWEAITPHPPLQSSLRGGAAALGLFGARQGKLLNRQKAEERAKGRRSDGDEDLVEGSLHGSDGEHLVVRTELLDDIYVPADGRDDLLRQARLLEVLLQLVLQHSVGERDTKHGARGAEEVGDARSSGHHRRLNRRNEGTSVMVRMPP